MSALALIPRFIISAPTLFIRLVTIALLCFFSRFGNLLIMSPSWTKIHLDPIFSASGCSWTSRQRLELSFPDNFCILPLAPCPKAGSLPGGLQPGQIEFLYSCSWACVPAAFPSLKGRSSSWTCPFQSVLLIQVIWAITGCSPRSEDLSLQGWLLSAEC